MDVHQTICTVDIAGFGGMDRTRANYVAIRDGMYRSVEQAFAQSGIPWADCYQEGGGDSILALAPVNVAKGAFAGTLPRALVTALRAHNETHPSEERIKLRLALHAGEITYDDHGVTAPAIIHACRLLDARPLKEALTNSPGTLAMIVSDWFYTEVVRHHPQHAPEAYRRVSVDVKETSSIGWIRLPDHELPAEPPATVTDTPVVPAPVLRPASPEFYQVVDALEDIPCMQDEHTRSLVIDQLRFVGTIQYFTRRRAHLTSILRTCLDFEDGVMELVSAIMNQEPRGSLPVRRLLTLLAGGTT